MTTNAVVYTRVSTDRQAEGDKTSLDEQREACLTYAAGNHLEVIREFQDIGSGTDKDRPDFQRMLTEARAGAFDVIVCWKDDRLWRGIYPAAALKEAITPHDVVLHDIRGELDLRHLFLMAAIAEMERENLKERTMMGRRGAAKAGRIPVGSVPLGYRRGQDGKPVIDPDEAEIVRRIFDETVAGHGGKQIADSLNAEGIRTPSGAVWREGTLHYIIYREAYAGRSAYFGVDVEFPPIVSQDTFDEAQAARRRRIRPTQR